MSDPLNIQSIVKVQLFLDEDLMHAVNNADLEGAKLALDKGADANLYLEDGSTPILKAAEDDNKEMISLLLDRGANGSHILHRSALYKQTDMLEFVLSKGVDINALNFEGESALVTALHDITCVMVNLLLAKGIKANTVNSRGQSPLEMAKIFNPEATAIIERHLLQRSAEELPILTPDPKAKQANRVRI